MDKIKTQLRRLGYFTKKDFLTVHNVATVGAIILGLVFSYNAITATTRNWQLEQKLKERTLESAKLGIEVETLELQKQYFNTDEYLEIMARKKQNKMLPGETMVILPNNSEKAKEKYNNIDSETTQKRSNFEEWLDFLFS
ncbi:MAG: septum formation initiator family protein [Candidatus Saccharibacteria bacterium]|nr:septum formation initiator family protein [Candidatus Saccharibacteria bacterium]